MTIIFPCFPCSDLNEEYGYQTSLLRAGIVPSGHSDHSHQGIISFIGGKEQLQIWVGRKGKMYGVGEGVPTKVFRQPNQAMVSKMACKTEGERLLSK